MELIQLCSISCCCPLHNHCFQQSAYKLVPLVRTQFQRWPHAAPPDWHTRVRSARYRLTDTSGDVVSLCAQHKYKPLMKSLAIGADAFTVISTDMYRMNGCISIFFIIYLNAHTWTRCSLVQRGFQKCQSTHKNGPGRGGGLCSGPVPPSI